MSHFGDFMDGVPVKISEKYKRPPRIELPHNISESCSRAQNTVDNTYYCFTYEKNVLVKLKELKNAKETKKNERRHRLQLLEESKQKRLDDLAAAEAEEKLKQLSVSDVSYPSTEEISEISPDKSDKTYTALSPDEVEVQSTMPVVENLPAPSFCQPQEPLNNILQPIPVHTYQSNNLLDDPDPLHQIRMQNKPIRYTQYNPAYSQHNIDSLTYKDFENDNSSPFDNIELKTINDMELLAQVLQNQSESNTNCPQQMQYDNSGQQIIPTCGSQAQVEGMTYLPNMYQEQMIQDTGVMYNSPQHYPVANGYYMSAENCENIPMNSMYVPNYPYYMTGPAYPANTQYYDQVGMSPIPDPSYIPHPYYFSYPKVPVSSQVDPYSMNPGTSTTSPVPEFQNTKKSRSRSVPDIVKELDAELESARQRRIERSCNVSPAARKLDVPKMESRESKIEKLPNPFEKLPIKLQDMCKNIHAMGFPLDRVARVCTLLGDNDKKVIEGLLILGELMDLGFSEGKVSAVLAKHEFNRDKALDELIP